MKKTLCVCLALLVMLSACSGNPTASAEKWQEQYDLGVRYLEEGNYEEAIIAFSAAIEIDPKRAEGYMRLAETYETIGKTEEALSVLQSGFETTGDITLSDMIESLEDGIQKEKNNQVVEELIARLPKVRSEQFITCEAMSFPALPDWSKGLISSHQVDIDSDGVAEAILTRADENSSIFVDIYDITGEEATLCSSADVTSFSYCDQIDVELFYNTVLNCWCITADSGSSGAYTGATTYSLALYRIKDRKVSLEKSWDWNNVEMLFEDNNIVSEAERSGVNFLSCQATILDRRTQENKYHELARIQSTVLSGEYPPEYTWAMTISGNCTLEAESSPAPSPAVIPTASSEPSQEEKIQTIRGWYQEIQNYQLRHVAFGDAAAAFWAGDDLVSCEYYEEGNVELVNPIGTTYRYYYKDGEPFFAYFTGLNGVEENTLRLYFWDGKLIQYKENQGAPCDGPNASYDGYYEDAIYHYNNMVDRPNG